MSSATALSKKDSAVLGALFDPEATLSGQPHISPLVPGLYSLQEAHGIKQWERDILLNINSVDPKPAEIEANIAQLSKLIERYPKHASAYNNRAQARRLLFDSKDLPKYPQDLDSIFDDIAHAITLASPSSDDDAAVSPEQARVLASAHTHRGYLLYKASRAESHQDLPNSVVLGKSALDRETLEEMASRDFAVGGKYGNRTAKQMAVKTNPYAKLCSSIVKQALQEEIFAGR